MRDVPSFDRRSLVLAAATVASLWLAGCATAPAADAASVLRQAEQAMGGVGLKTLSFTGSGTGGTFGQAWQPAMGWPGLNYSVLTRVVDYDNGAIREDFGRSRSEPNGGGAIPLMGGGEARATGFARGAFAWNAAGNAAAPAPVALDARIHDLWTSPHGVLKAAARNKASASSRVENGVTYTALSFTEPGRFTATAWVDSAGMVTKVESRLPHPVTGDTDVVTTYGDYKDFGGVKFPQRIRQSQAGSPVLDIAVKDVKANVAVDIAVPDNVRNFAERVSSEKVADGVWFLAGGSHNSVAIEMKDHLVVVETPLYDGRSAAVLAEAKKLAPGKPVRYVINSHHHFDHAGGLRTAVAEGATLVTSAMAKPYFEKVLANPNRISPDLMARSGKAASIMSVSGKQVLSDGSRTIEVHEMQGSVHAQGFMMVWLPKERLLVQADAYTPAPPNSPPPPAPNGNNVNLVQNIDRLGLNVDRLLPLHGRVVPLSELHAAIGRK